MPIYTYRCDSCEEEFRISHSMTEIQEICEVCESINTLARVPSIFSNLKIEKKQKVGTCVKEYIEQAKEDVKDQKRALKDKND